MVGILKIAEFMHDHLVNDIQALARHSSLQQTQKYIEVSPDAMRKVMGCLRKEVPMEQVIMIALGVVLGGLVLRFMGPVAMFILVGLGLLFFVFGF
jgi:hypothetical protein